jgi:hypothetical protein
MVKNDSSQKIERTEPEAAPKGIDINVGGNVDKGNIVVGDNNYVVNNYHPNSSTPRYSPPNSYLYWILTILICFIIIGFGLFTILSGQYRSKSLTVYFVIDATEKMQPIFNSVLTQVNIASSGLDDNARIGFRVFGGDSGGSENCQESKQLLAPTTFENKKDVLHTTLTKIIPQGHSSMTGAILQTLLFDLEKESSRSVRLILITSGVDSLCDPQSGDLISNVIKNKNIDLTIISVGQQNEQSISVFKSYADAFQGEYLPLPNVESLIPVVQRISLYGYGYGYGNQEVTPIP